MSDTGLLSAENGISIIKSYLAACYLVITDIICTVPDITGLLFKRDKCRKRINKYVISSEFKCIGKCPIDTADQLITVFYCGICFFKNVRTITFKTDIQGTAS